MPIDLPKRGTTVPTKWAETPREKWEDEGDLYLEGKDTWNMLWKQSGKFYPKILPYVFDLYLAYISGKQKETLLAYQGNNDKANN